MANKNSLSLHSGSAKVGDGDGYTTICRIKNVDINDTEAVNRELRSFCDEFSDAKIEYSMVITQSGKVYTLSGTSVSVDPSIIGESELKGSIGIHNHPVPEGANMGDSFSRGDLIFAANYKVGIQHLASGVRRNTFALTKEYSTNEIAQAWETAKMTMLEKAFNGEIDLDTDWEQEEIMKVLAEQLEGLKFYGNL